MTTEETKTNGNGKEAKPTTTYHAPPIENYSNKTHLVTRIGVGTGIGENHPNKYDRFEIGFERILLDDYNSFEEALKGLETLRGIDADPQKVLDNLLKSIFTAPDYHSVLCYQEGEKGPDGIVVTPGSEFYKVLKPNGHEAAQALADNFKVGQRVTGPSQKKIVAEAKAAEADTGMSVAEMAAKIKEMQEQGLLGD